jgi:predicted nucleotidyltransferase component of viral defense system
MLSINAITNFYPPNLHSQKRNMLREYMQYKILQAIFESELSPKLSFLGGTALRIIHENSRFSEDLDFDNFGLTEEEFIQTSDVVKKALEREGYEVEFRTVHKGGYRCYLRLPKVLFDNNLSPLPDEKIFIQIDTASHGFEYKPDIININKFDVFTSIPITPKDIIFSQKVYAIFKRPRTLGRDFFDLVFLISLGVKPNYHYLEYKLQISNEEILREKMVEKIRTIDFEQLAKDIEPFIFNSSDSKKVTMFPALFQDAKL